VAAWTKAGIEVSYCVITDGQAGGFDPELDRADMPGIRREEQTRAAAEVGVHDLAFLGYVDGELELGLGLVQDLTRVVRRVRPDRVLTQSPERDWQRLAPSHPDHLVGAEAATRALFPAAGNPFAFPHLAEAEGLEAWSPREVWLMDHPTSNHAVDVTDHFPAKMAALLAHESQHPDPERIEQLMRDKLTATAVEYDLGEGRLGEKFAVYRLP
jgi:LmbE family N-acetylglucosaminyl deacetylase